MKMFLKYVIITLSLSLLLTGCTISKSYTFKVETGDKIKVELKTNDKYDIDSNIPFTISKDDEKITQGTLIKVSAYEEYETSINSSTAKIIENETKKELEYIFYSYDNDYGTTEYNYIIKIKDSNTGIVLSNTISEESAKEVFNRLTITKE